MFFWPWLFDHVFKDLRKTDLPDSQDFVRMSRGLKETKRIFWRYFEFPPRVWILFMGFFEDLSRSRGYFEDYATSCTYVGSWPFCAGAGDGPKVSEIVLDIDCVPKYDMRLYRCSWGPKKSDGKSPKWVGHKRKHGHESWVITIVSI